MASSLTSNILVLCVVLAAFSCRKGRGGEETTGEGDGTAGLKDTGSCLESVDGYIKCENYDNVDAGIVASAKYGCEFVNDNATWAIGELCVQTGVIGYCTGELPSGEDYSVYYYPNWTETLAEAACSNENEGTYTSGSPP